jgi:uroporphyrinogen decarboxylase
MALNHYEPDRVPMDLGGTYVSTIHYIPYKDLLTHLDLHDEKMEIMAPALNTMLVGDVLRERFDLDFIRIAMKPASSYKMEYDKDNKFFYNEYGIRWMRGDEKTGIHYPNLHPLMDADISAIKSYKLPDMRDPSRVAGLREEAQRIYETTDYAIIGDGNFSFLQTCHDFIGMEEFFMDLIADRPRIRALMDKIAEHIMDGIELFVKSIGDYVDVITFADDLGTQNGPMFSPIVYRQLIKPYHKLFVDLCHKYTNAKLFFHCDGGIMDFLDDVVDVGFDILNPVQCTAKGMDPRELKKRFGKHLSFWGGIDAQTIMAFGSPEEVEVEVKKKIDILGDGGGYILGNTHVIEYGVTPENITALFDTGLNYSNYDDRR